MDVDERVRAIVAEMRAQELVAALTNAVAGAPHWRLEAQAVLDRIEGGVPPDQHKEAA